MTPVGPDLVSPLARAERDAGPTCMPPGKCEEVIAGREVVLVRIAAAARCPGEAIVAAMPPGSAEAMMQLRQGFGPGTKAVAST
jgi:hypothetical protein